MPALPPGQIVTTRFPVVGEREPSPDLEDWSLSILGLTEDPRVLDLDDLFAFQQRQVTFDIHCVTSWSRLDSTFTGVPLSDLVSPLPEARYVSFAAYSQHDHHTSLPLDYAMEHSWVVHRADGEALSAEHGGPVRVVTPGRYFYKSIKWLRTIELLADDRLGWWEVNSSYHNNANPFSGDERFTTGSVRPEQLERFKNSSNLDKYRGRVMIGLDLTDWQPATRDLRRLYLKNCDLSGVDLSKSDLREANLSLSDLTSANLSDADLSGSDLEGADFSDADLSNANLSGTALSATRFDGAEVDGASFDGVWGLLEGQAFYLESRGVSLRTQ